jgi:hypothetical protein
MGKRLVFRLLAFQTLAVAALYMTGVECTEATPLWLWRRGRKSPLRVAERALTRVSAFSVSAPAFRIARSPRSAALCR